MQHPTIESPPMPTGLRGMLADPATSVERVDESEGVTRTYFVTFNVNEKFVQLPRAEQTSQILELAKWFGAHVDDKPNVALVFYAALHGRRIGWCDGPGWTWWEDAYVEAVARMRAA